MVRKLSLKRRTFKKSLKRYKRSKGYKRRKKNTLKRRVSKKIRKNTLKRRVSRKTLRRKNIKGGRPRYGPYEHWTPDNFEEAIAKSDGGEKEWLEKQYEFRSKSSRHGNFTRDFDEWRRKKTQKEADQLAEEERLAKQRAKDDRLTKQEPARREETEAPPPVTTTTTSTTTTSETDSNATAADSKTDSNATAADSKTEYLEIEIRSETEDPEVVRLAFYSIGGKEVLDNNGNKIEDYHIFAQIGPGDSDVVPMVQPLDEPDPQEPMLLDYDVEREAKISFSRDSNIWFFAGCIVTHNENKYLLKFMYPIKLDDLLKKTVKRERRIGTERCWWGRGDKSKCRSKRRRKITDAVRNAGDSPYLIGQVVPQILQPKINAEKQSNSLFHRVPEDP